MLENAPRGGFSLPYTHTPTHTHIFTLLPFRQCETTLMGTLTEFNRQPREKRPAGLHHKNHCVQRESISAFQCNSILFTMGREAIWKWKCHLTSSEGRKAAKRGGEERTNSFEAAAHGVSLLACCAYPCSSLTWTRFGKIPACVCVLRRIFFFLRLGERGGV